MRTLISDDKSLPRTISRNLWHKPIALALTASLLVPTLAGCGGNTPPPPADATTGQAPMAPAQNANQNRGMSGKQKLVLLAGAAALYYMYKRQRDANDRPVKTQYYLSKNGRVYYRDPAKNNQAIYVTPPPGGLRIPADQAREYEQFQGYEGRNQGRSLDGLATN